MQETLLNNRYQIERKIGEGGMATVYQGQDLRLNRRVAIKILHSQYSTDPDFIKRFQHEAQAAATLNHPNVVNVYDVGQEGNTHYIVMQYVDGMNLKTLINRDAPLMIGQAIAITEAIAQGLEAAHRVGMVHRDIKPQNILITSDGHVSITDFGIAKSYLSTAKTQTGITFGTADYISPEQAQGGQASPRSDIYALGITLFEMLTGRLPFTGDSAIGVAMQHISTPPPLPRQINPNIPPGLEALMLKAIAKDPSQRPASAQEFAQLLRNYRTQSDQHTMVSPDLALQPPKPTPPRLVISPPSGGSAANATGRNTIPSPRSTMAKAPQQQGIGCGIFIVGMLVLVGVVGLVIIFSTGSFGSLFSSTQPKQTLVASSHTPTPTVTPSPTPTIEPTATPIPFVTVPNIVGLSESEATKRLQSANLVPVRGSRRNDDTIAPGFVVAQDIPSSTEVREFSSVTYTLSLGPKIELIEVPKLDGLRLEVARKMSENLGLKVEAIEEANTQVSEGFVIRQEPNPNMRVEKNDTLRLYVSIGDKVRMPNVIGKSEQEARVILSSSDGVFYSYTDYQGRDKLGDQYDTIAPGTVVSTIPDKDVWVPRDTGVTLGVRR